MRRASRTIRSRRRGRARRRNRSEPPPREWFICPIEFSALLFHCAATQGDRRDCAAGHAARIAILPGFGKETVMALTLLDSKGTPLEQQRFTWKELAPKPISKLDDDAFTRVRIILMNGVETDALRLKHMCSRMNRDLRVPLAQVRRAEHHQQTMVSWLLGADHSPLETTIAYEQVAIEVTAALAQNEPDPYVAQALRFGLLEDFDHLYRYSALADRVEGLDPNNILQTYTDIMAGRPTAVEHRAPEDDVRNS